MDGSSQTSKLNTQNLPHASITPTFFFFSDEPDIPIAYVVIY